MSNSTNNLNNVNDDNSDYNYYTTRYLTKTGEIREYTKRVRKGVKQIQIKLRKRIEKELKELTYNQLQKVSDYLENMENTSN